MADFQMRTSDVEAGELLRTLAEQDMRSMGNEIAWIIRQEAARRGLISLDVQQNNFDQTSSSSNQLPTK